jgi:ABC-type polysaccharide/polyol phosphate transport system ATPase subunit
MIFVHRLVERVVRWLIGFVEPQLHQTIRDAVKGQLKDELLSELAPMMALAVTKQIGYAKTISEFKQFALGKIDLLTDQTSKSVLIEELSAELRCLVRQAAGLTATAPNSPTLPDLLHEISFVRANQELLAPAFSALSHKRVLFAGQAYYNAWYLSRALRSLGWKADVLNWDMNPTSQIYYHGEDIAFDVNSPILAEQMLAFYVSSLYLYDIIHFSNSQAISFGWPVQSIFEKHFSKHSEIFLLKGIGKKIVYTNNGCLDGVAQTTFAKWGPESVCSICRWRDEPSVCSDERNLTWGKFRNSVADFQCTLGGNRVDYNSDPRVHEVPEFCCLDKQLWAPEIEIPEKFRLPLEPTGMVRLYHAVGHKADRTNEEGVNIKSSHIYAPLIQKLTNDGLLIDLLEPTGVPNKEVRYLQAQADIFLEMLTYGWFGANAREAMMLGKPVICYIRPEWLESVRQELPDYASELPIISATPETVEGILRDLIANPEKRLEVGRKSREFAVKWHSADAGGKRFDEIYSGLLTGDQLLFPPPLEINVMADAMQNFALRCVQVDKYYPTRQDLKLHRLLLGVEPKGQMIHALRDISLNVPRGKIVGILGKNGAGKSTLLRVLGGVFKPSRGYVEAAGQISGLFELGGMGNPNLSGRDYAIRYLRLMGVEQSSIQAFLKGIQEFSELCDAFEHPIRTYSSGMGARLYFATATALESDVYLIDEILSVGDEHFQLKCWQRMRERLLGGASGVLVTHDWAAVLKLCEQSHVIEKGGIVFSGPSDRAVVSYLKIPLPNATTARFSPRNAQRHVAKSGEDTSICLWVDVFEPGPVDFSISIETLRIGIGWEIVILTESMPVAEQPGTYALKVSIPNLPVAPGEYSLNVFLTRRRKSLLDKDLALDIRSWTTGNGYCLQVEGRLSNAAVLLPYVALPLDDGAY